MAPTPTIVSNDQRAAIRLWLAGLMARHAIKPADIQKATGIAQSTIYRMLDENGPHIPRLDKVAQIARAYDEPMPGATPQVSPERGMAEGDAQPFLEDAPADILPQTPDQSVWRIGNRALELAGFMPGDLVLLDMARAPKAGDFVIAQIYDFETGTALTRLRRYDGIYLTTASMDPTHAERPMPVDGERVVLMGPLVKLSRKLA